MSHLDAVLARIDAALGGQAMTPERIARLTSEAAQTGDAGLWVAVAIEDTCDGLNISTADAQKHGIPPDVPLKVHMATDTAGIVFSPDNMPGLHTPTGDE